MDVLSAVASVVAVIQIAAEVAKLCGGYLHDVKHAPQDTERMKAKTLALHDVLERLKNTSESNIDRTAIQQCLQDLKSLKEKLDPKKKNHAPTKYWARALKWPFSSKEANETMKALEGYLTIFNMALQINISDKVSDAEQERILERLAVAADAPFDSYENQRHRPCLEKTRVGILQQIMQWATSPSPQCVFWLKGMAGTGKSTVAITVASMLQKSSRSSASYFFKRGIGDLAHARKLISTLVYQLAKESPSFCREVMLALKREPSLGHTASLREQYYKLLIDPVRKSQSCVQRKDPFILVIDALDECEEQQDVGLLLQLVAQTDQISTLPFRIFVTSRPDKRIRRGFGDMPNILYHSLVLHDEPRSNVDNDIELFLRKELEKVGHDQELPLEWPADSKIQTLVEKAAGLFIFASTACHYIGDSPQALPEERLDQICNSITTTHNMNQEMDQMYTLILQNSIQGSFTDEEQARFHRVVGTVVMLLSPLSIPELHKLLYNSQPEGGRLVKHSLWSLHAVFNVPESSNRPVQPLHLSFRDFLLDGDRCLDRRFWIDERHVHNELAMDCIRLLSTSLHRDMCRLPSLGTLKSEIAQKDIENALSPAVQYACRYWTDHVEKGKLELPDYGRVHELLLQHFLHWLEAMSLMGKVSEAIIAITNMTAMINSQKSPIMYDLIHDCRRFLLAFRQGITDVPNQIYASALLFSPSHSTVRKIFSDVVPQWVKLHSLHREQWSSNLQTLEGHSNRVHSVIFSPDGQLMASGSEDHTVRLWDTQTGECRSLLEGHSGPVLDVVFSPDGQLMASGSEDHTVRLWDTQTGECRSLLEGHSGPIFDVAFSPDGQLMASGSDDHTVRLWNTQTGKCRSLLKGHSGWIKNVAFSPDGQLVVASGSEDEIVRLWDVQSGLCHSLLQGHSHGVSSIAFSPDGQLMASGSYDNTVRIWDTQTGECRSLLEGHSSLVLDVVFSPDGRLLASGSYDYTIRIWNTQTGECCFLLEGHSSSVEIVVFSPGGQLVASGSYDHTVRLWDVQTGRCHSLLEGHSGSVKDVVFSPDGQLVASGSKDHTIRLWDAQTGECRSSPEGHSGWVTDVVFSPDGRLVASGSQDHTIRLWDAKTGECRSLLDGHSGPVENVVFSPDGQLVASGSDDQTVRLWHVQSGECHTLLEGHSDGVSSVAFSPDGQLMASGSYDTTLRLWDTQTGECRSLLEGHSNLVMRVVFSPDGRLLASGSYDYTVRIWNTQTGECCFLLEGHSSWVPDVAFSPDGRLVASGSQDHTIRLWDAKTGECRSLLDGHSGPVENVVFSPDGQLVASGSWDLTVRLWDVQSGNHVSTVSCSSRRPQIEFHAGLGLISADGATFEILSAKRTKALTDDSRCPTSTLEIYATKDWVVKSSERVLWLPPDYRPTSYDSYGNTIVLGLGSGEVCFLSFEDRLD